MRCTLEVWTGRWVPAAEVRVDDTASGHESAARLEYDFDYLDRMVDALGARDVRAVSCRYPIGYEVWSERTWPAFLLDLIPSGAARRFWERELGVPNNPSSDWVVLTRGAGNPPGNVRVAEAAALMPPPVRHEGFAKRDVLSRKDTFIEHARAHGASIAGGSGAGGDAPKLMLRRDEKDRWHADGALADEWTASSWIVKFPKSAREADRLVLRAEASYYALARALGARTTGRLTWQDDCLFIPRFDRTQRRDGTIVRLGMESLASLAGVAEWGASTPKERLSEALARSVSDPARELREWLLRDVLDVALGNTDNHARNTSVLKHHDGRVELAPLYDFAPMFFDPQGIARVCRWREEDGGYPRWPHVVATLAELGLDGPAAVAELRALAPRIRALPAAMRKAKVPEPLIDMLDARVRRVAKDLEATR